MELFGSTSLSGLIEEQPSYQKSQQRYGYVSSLLNAFASHHQQKDFTKIDTQLGSLKFDDAKAKTERDTLLVSENFVFVNQFHNSKLAGNSNSIGVFNKNTLQLVDKFPHHVSEGYFGLSPDNKFLFVFSSNTFNLNIYPLALIGQNKAKEKSSSSSSSSESASPFLKIRGLPPAFSSDRGIMRFVVSPSFRRVKATKELGEKTVYGFDSETLETPTYFRKYLLAVGLGGDDDGIGGLFGDCDDDDDDDDGEKKFGFLAELFVSEKVFEPGFQPPDTVKDCYNLCFFNLETTAIPNHDTDTFDGFDDTESVAFSPDGKFLACMTSSGYLVYEVDFNADSNVSLKMKVAQEASSDGSEGHILSWVKNPRYSAPLQLQQQQQQQQQEEEEGEPSASSVSASSSSSVENEDVPPYFLYVLDKKSNFRQLTKLALDVSKEGTTLKPLEVLTISKGNNVRPTSLAFNSLGDQVFVSSYRTSATNFQRAAKESTHAYQHETGTLRCYYSLLPPLQQEPITGGGGTVTRQVDPSFMICENKRSVLAATFDLTKKSAADSDLFLLEKTRLSKYATPRKLRMKNALTLFLIAYKSKLPKISSVLASEFNVIVLSFLFLPMSAPRTRLITDTDSDIETGYIDEDSDEDSDDSFPGLFD